MGRTVRAFVVPKILKPHIRETKRPDVYDSSELIGQKLEHLMLYQWRNAQEIYPEEQYNVF